jgi:hypothetical protein
MIHAICFAALLAAASTAVAQLEARKCTTAEAVAAEAATDNLTNWANVHRFFRQFGHCYDGAIAGNGSDRIQTLLADRWSELPQLLKYMSEDSQFKQFILSIVASEAFPQSTFRTVLAHANNLCPKNGAEFCLAIKSAAKHAQ